MFSRMSNFLGRLDIKLTTNYTLILLVFSFALCTFIYYRLESSLMQQVDLILIDEKRELVEDFEKFGNDILRASEAHEEKVSHRQYFPIDFRILYPSGKVLYSTKGGEELPSPLFEDNQIPFVTVPKEEKNPYRIYQEEFTHNSGKKFILQMATHARLTRNITENYLDTILHIIPVLLICSIVCGIVVSRKPREVLHNIIVSTNRITSRNLQERIPVPKIGDEIQGIIITINNMIERLEKSFNEVKQFTSDVSHELRTPLSALKGALEAGLSQQRTDREYGKILANCLEQANLITAMLNDLFLISRFEAKKYDLDITDLNLGTILKDLVSFYLPLAGEKSIDLAIGPCADVVMKGDRTRIHQLFNNLIDNAIKFTPPAGSINLSLRANRDSVQFLIKDSGIGIPEEDLPNIFQRFYQVDKSRSGLGGVGLGLNICEKIVEAHGGEISVKRNPDKGVTFTVTLPLQPSHPRRSGQTT